MIHTGVVIVGISSQVAVNLGDVPAVDGGWSDLVRDDDWVFPTELERRSLEMSRLPPAADAPCTLLMMVSDGWSRQREGVY